MTLVVEPFGDAAVRVRLPEGSGGPALLARLRALPGVIDAVVTEEHALVAFDPAAPPTGIVSMLTNCVGQGGALDPAVGTVEPPLPSRAARAIRVRYDGPDLDEVARATGLPPREVVALHTAPSYVVAAIGFLPGFAYLRGLDPRLVLPRRSTPRPRVAALSVAIAGPYSGVYPFASPGGWHLLGTAVDFAPFAADRGAALALGDHVTFVEAP